MPYSSDLTDKEWEIIQPLLPQKKSTRPPGADKATNPEWHLVSTEERLQLGRPAERPAALLHRILTLQAVAVSRSSGANQGCFAGSGANTSKKNQVDNLASD
ncbi:hypothetical protein QUB63_27890 [Microcoleus sp. ARI1-B5]|uniref:hypothetical protein n=1 Tax=unclassified Microcoleus TaxID=2642155 RepID=UPI002FCED3C6